MSGAAGGPGAVLLRLLLSGAEPVYKLAVEFRNRRYDRNASRIARLPRPVISIGNLTTGGTGKTPVVRWVCNHLRERGKRVCVLSRGYRSGQAGQPGDEQRMLSDMLNDDPMTAIRFEADPDRRVAADRALANDPKIDLFVLDDGFQHRRIARSLDIVLIHSAEPFGYGHLLPRGMLREPLRSLARANAIILTHVDLIDSEALSNLKVQIQKWNPTAPILQSTHRPVRLRRAEDTLPLTALRGRRVFIFSGIGDPSSFERQSASLAEVVGTHRFADHHPYNTADLDRLNLAARTSRAELLLTTEKDWVKLRDLPGAASLAVPIWRLDVEIDFAGSDGATLLSLILQAMSPALSNSQPTGA